MTSTSKEIFISPVTGNTLHVADAPLRLWNDSEEFIATDGVFRFLPATNEAYEGAYLNKIKFVPRIDIWPFNFPLWMMAHGYVWAVRQNFSKGALICELGCASGVNYFGRQFRMIGLDYSFSSLRGIENYQYRIQANAIALPFQNESLDGIISSFFWEHISPEDKVMMLKEFHRVLRPGGKVVLLYDVHTSNFLIKQLKDESLQAYEDLFLKGDYHIGYETMDDNLEKFRKAGFIINKHLGMERTVWLSNSAYTKLATRQGWYGRFSGILKKITSVRSLAYAHMLLLRVIDESVGRLFNKNKSRIALSVLQKPHANSR